MHLQSEKVTSTCSQRFAELDPHCPSMLVAACESFRAGADACRLSLASVAMNVVRGVQTDPKRRIWREPCNRSVPYSHISDTTGRFCPVSMIHVHTHLESLVKHRLWIQLPSSSNVDGAWKQGLFWTHRTICGDC